MVQKEAAIRLCAAPGTRECGAISGAIWYRAKPEMLFSVSGGSFMPPPDVESAVIRLDILKEPPVSIENEALFFRIIKGAFSQRRKTAINALSSCLGMSKAQIGRAHV